MPPTEYCVYNETRSSCLISRVTVIDAQAEPLRAVKVLIEGLPLPTDPNTISALWLNPLRSIPSVPRLSPYDLVYLDHEGRVVHSVELVPDDEAPRYDGTAASALVLPLHSFNASSSSRGDRVLLRPAPEPNIDWPATAPSPAAPSQASLPRALATPEQGPARAWASTFTANPFVLQAPPARDARLSPDPLPTPQQSVLPFDQPAATPPAKKLAAFHLLRSIARLRIRVQISIALEPIAAQAASRATVLEPANAITAQPQEQRIRPLLATRAATNRAANRSARLAARCATGLTSITSAATTRMRHAARSSVVRSLSLYARASTVLRHTATRLADRIAFFSTVTLPIFFEHTLPTAAVRSRRRFVRTYTSSKRIYLLWADALFEEPSSTSNARPVRRPPVSVRHVEPRRDPVRQLLRPRS